jgi:hypothetical protein
MLVSKSITSWFIVAVASAGAALAWQVREHAALQAEAGRESTVAELRVLEQQVAQQSKRLGEAESRLSTLLKTADASRTARTRPDGLAMAAAAAKANPDGPIDTSEIARVAVEKGRALMKEGKSQEALDLYLATYREVQPFRPGSPACQRLTSEIKFLGRSHPPALVALTQLRDDAMRQLEAQPARRDEWVFEIALLNGRLDQADRTIALFDALPPGDIQRGSLAMVARDAFVQARRYPDALLGKSFGQMLGIVDSTMQVLAKETDAARQAMIRKNGIEQTATNIEVLAGAGKAAEAQQLTEKLLAFDNSETTRRAIEQHLARAAGRKP